MTMLVHGRTLSFWLACSPGRHRRKHIHAASRIRTSDKQKDARRATIGSIAGDQTRHALRENRQKHPAADGTSRCSISTNSTKKAHDSPGHSSPQQGARRVSRHPHDTGRQGASALTMGGTRCTKASPRLAKIGVRNAYRGTHYRINCGEFYAVSIPLMEANRHHV